MKKKNYVLFIVLLLLSLIPVLYSTLFLGALRDPYGKVNQLPVALVKTDTANTVYDKLYESDMFNFKIENRQEAKQSLDDGTVYAAISFEDDFTEKIAKFPSNEESPIMTLTTSEGLNSSGVKILTSGISQFVNNVNESLSHKMIQEFNENKQSIPPTIGSIVKLNHIEISPIQNNAEALAPYIFSLTLFVGAIFTNQFIMRRFPNKETRYYSYWKRQFMYPLLITFAQVIILAIVNTAIIHVNIDLFLEFILFLTFVATVFCSIIVGFNKLIPGIGSIIVLLIMMLQTSSSGGTYPIDLSSGFFQKIHMFIPMTYSIEGLRKLISLNNQNIGRDISVLLLFLVVSQIILVLSFHIHEKKKPKDILVP